MYHRSSLRFRLSLRTWGLVVAASVLPACSAPEDPNPLTDPIENRHASYRRVRVVVNDGITGEISIFDAEENAWIASIEMDGPRELIASESGDFATLVSSSAEKVGFLRGGVSVSPHEDHLHIYKFPPTVHDLELTGSRPNAVVSNARKIGIFFEDTGEAGILLEEEMVPRGATPSPIWYSSGEKHEGLVIPMATGAFMTNPATLNQMGGKAGLLMYAHEAERTEIATDCPSIQGAAGLGEKAAVACADGVLVVSLAPNGGGANAKKWAYPGGGRAQTLQGHAPSGFIAGNLDKGAVFWLDVTTGQTKLFEAKNEICGYALEPAKAESIGALTVDGALHVFDIETGTSKTLTAVVPPFVCNSSENTPKLAMTPDRIYLTGPNSGEVIEVGLEPLVIRQRHALGGVPSNIVVLGIDTANADLAPGSD